MNPSQALRHLTYATTSRKPIPQWVSINPSHHASGHFAILSATDGITYSRIIVPWRDAPTCIVEGKALAKAVKGIDEWSGAYEAGDCPTLRINGAILRCLVGETFPPTLSVAPDARMDAVTDYTLDAINVERALLARDTLQSRPVLSGIAVLGDSSRPCSCAATDGKILIHAGHLPGNPVAQVCILPEGIASGIAAYGGTGTLTIKHNQAQWKSADGILTLNSRTVEGTFPSFLPALETQRYNTPIPGTAMLDVICAASEGMPTGGNGESVGVIVTSKGAGPVSDNKGGRRIRHDTGIPTDSVLAFDAYYCRIVRKLEPKRMDMGRGLRLEGDGWTGLVMPIVVPPDTKPDFSDGVTIQPKEAKKAKPRTDKEEIARLRGILMQHGIPY